MNSPHANPVEQPVSALEATPEAARVLTPAQGKARSAFIDFCWNLQLARAKKPDDPTHSETTRAVVLDILESSAKTIRQRGIELYEAWEQSGGHEIIPAIFTREQMELFLAGVDATRIHHATMQQFYASIAGKAPPPVQDHPKGPGLANS